MPSVDVERLIKILREMDATQAKTDAYGQREVAWTYYRNDIEDTLGLERGALYTGEYDPDATG